MPELDETESSEKYLDVDIGDGRPVRGFALTGLAMMGIAIGSFAMEVREVMRIDAECAKPIPRKPEKEVEHPILYGPFDVNGHQLSFVDDGLRLQIDDNFHTITGLTLDDIGLKMSPGDIHFNIGKEGLTGVEQASNEWILRAGKHHLHLPEQNFGEMASTLDGLPHGSIMELQTPYTVHIEGMFGYVVPKKGTCTFRFLVQKKQTGSPSVDTAVASAVQ